MKKKVIIAILVTQLASLSCQNEVIFASKTDNSDQIEVEYNNNSDILQQNKTTEMELYGASSYDENGFAWDGLTIIGYNGNDKDITIPSKANSIGQEAFYGNKNIVSVTVPSSVKSIGAYAFGGCTSLKKINLSSNLKTISGGAFSGCSNLNNVVIPQKVESIESYAFENCSSMDNFEIKSNVLSSASSRIFSGCEMLKNINISGNLTKIPSYMFEGAEYLETVSLPQTIKSIGTRAFCGCKSLSKIDLPDGLTSIGGGAFCACSSLNNVTIPSKVSVIESEAFEDCSNIDNFEIKSNVLESTGSGIFSGCEKLKNIDITGRLTSIPQYMFESAVYLETVNLPTTIKNIEARAFWGCSSLKEIKLPNGLISIGSGAFTDCTSLEMIVIPSDVKEIEYAAFSGCTSLSDFEIKSPLLTYVGGSVFDNCYNLKKIKITGNMNKIPDRMFDGASYIEEVNIPDTVTSIGVRAFSNCESLKEIYLPDNVNTIESSAFSGCTSLSEIKLPKGLSSIGMTAFESCTELKSMIIPNKVESIGSEAFFDCTQLENIIINNPTVYFGSDIFENDYLLKMYCFKNSTAEEYANTYGIDYDPSLGIYSDKINITEQPDDIFAEKGKQATWKVTASGNNLKYQWQYKSDNDSTWTNFQSATSSSMSKVVGDWNGWKIRCKISDSQGNVSTTAVSLLHVSEIRINSQPSDIAVAEGKQATWKVVAQGDNLNYQWQYKSSPNAIWTNFQSATESSMTKTVGKWNGWQIRCLITDSNGISKTSDVATIYVAMVNITSQPTDVTVAEGKQATWKVSAEGNNLKYQWQYKSSANAGWTNFQSATGASMTKTVGKWNGWQVRCVIKDGNGNSVTTNTATIHISGIKITAQPADVTVAEGKQATWKVSAEGNNLKYQWQYKSSANAGWTNFQSATGASMTKTVGEWNGWQVRCVIKDGNGNSVTTNTVTIHISGIRITAQPADVTVAEGKQATWKVSAEGNNLKYQWQYKSSANAGWTNFQSATGASMTKTVGKWNGWQVRCVIADSNGNTVISNASKINLLIIDDWELPIM